MMKQQELHRVTDRLMNALGVRADFHVVRDRSRARRHEFRSAFDFHETHAATTFDTDIGMVAITRDLNADLVGDLDDGSPFFGFVYLSVESHFWHKQLE